MRKDAFSLNKNILGDDDVMASISLNGFLISLALLIDGIKILVVGGHSFKWLGEIRLRMVKRKEIEFHLILE